MPKRMSTSLEARAIMAELSDRLSHTVNNEQERRLWEYATNLSMEGWSISTETWGPAIDRTIPGSTKIAAVFGDAASLVLLQVWREVYYDHASTCIRAVGLRPPKTVSRLGRLIVRDPGFRDDYDMSIDDRIAHNAGGFNRALGYVLNGADHSKINGHASLAEDEVTEEAIWILSRIATAHAVPNAEITAVYRPADPE